MTLTAAQYTRLRDQTGGRTNTNDEDHLTDTELQEEYDDAGSWDLAVVYVLRRRLGMAAVYTDKSMDLNSQQLSQRREALEKLLARAEARAGVSGSTLTAGVLDLNIDTDSDDLDIA